MRGIKTITLKIEKLLRIKRCYQCDRIIWWQKDVLRYVEAPDDLGFVAPACKFCIAYSEEHQDNY